MVTELEIIIIGKSLSYCYSFAANHLSVICEIFESSFENIWIRLRIQD